jgi:hypothetical protein
MGKCSRALFRNNFIRKTMKKLCDLFIYLFLLFLGFFFIAWIVYNKYIRERLPKDIPIHLSERGFWTLIYLCCIYLFIITSLIFFRAKKSEKTIGLIRDILYTPLIAFDHLLKYNKYVKNFYCKVMDNFILLLVSLKHIDLLLINFYFQILPRMLLVYILFKDIFLFGKLEILYQFVLIGLIPFIHRYVKYSIKDMKDHYIEDMEKTCNRVHLFDEAYSNPNIDWEPNEDNKYHREVIPIKEFIEFKIKQEIYKTPETQYDHTWFPNEEIYREYRKKHNINLDPKIGKLTDDDYIRLKEPYNVLYEKCFNLGKFVEIYSNLGQKSILINLKIIIYTIYFICWTYILFISYHKFPVQFKETVNLIVQIIEILIKPENPFTGLMEDTFDNSIIINIFQVLQKLL